MKYIKHFEKFIGENVFANNSNSSIDDEITGPDAATFDHSNSPVLREKVKEYVQQVLHSNQSKIIFDALGLEQPEVEGVELDSMYDDIEEKAIEYFIKHPHKMVDLDDNSGAEANTMGIEGNPQNNPNDRIPKITN